MDAFKRKVTDRWLEGPGFFAKGRKFSISSGRYSGHAGLFFKGRKALPHFIERRISLKIHLRTAP
jgi:hypothetical protein